ncbi:5-oxoprolinase subunit C family protein [Neisseria weaveri]|uniref:5-oxoprolinase subunit C family protein n=1 Tax=Neisseria weaveri TaxID=28091 RepID=UPI000D30DE88|nr:biotin-dependent carboxyltransferase family protein [Neisseria weaveri]
MMYIRSIQAHAHIQDNGRYGLRRYGIGHAGAMDILALQTGNTLLGNDENAPAVEIALGGMRIEFGCDTVFCLTGALYEAELDGQAIHSYWRYPVKRGQTLTLTRAIQGMYGYLCVAGGVEVPEVLGSRSTDLKAGFGGFNGRLLQSGDELPIRPADFSCKPLGIAPIAFTKTIHALPSSEYGHFTLRSHYRFWQNLWTLQSDSNRMGYRFDGDGLELSQPLEMLSHAVQAGTVQVPPNGKPIILMADAQTTGGYPKIASIAAADLGRLAQNRFGSKIHFRMVSHHEAAQLQQKNRIYLNQIKRIVEHAR